MNSKLKEKLLAIPSSPGIYKFLNNKGNVMYIGKALNLNIRVNSYFKKTLYDRPTIIPMIPLIEDLEIVQTDSEIEALILESALIKKVNPYYNIDLKDDKSYAWIYVSNKEAIPSVKIVRTINKREYHKGLLFGPYPKGLTVKRVFQYIRRIYPFCTCKTDREEALYYEMGLCPGPRIGKISLSEYRKQIGKIIKLLNGNIVQPIDDLEKKMKLLSKNQDFEKAKEIRDKIVDLKYISQHIGYSPDESEGDYTKKRSEALGIEADRVAKQLGISSGNRIECYDISNLQGENSYGSMVVATNGDINTSQYRVFKIKTVEGANDYKMLAEVLKRRLVNIAKSDDSSLKEKPQIILIDGGKGQISELKDLIPNDIVLLGITKGRKYKRRGMKKKDEFWLYNEVEKEVKQINIENPNILIRLRDEAHRFAIRHYRAEKIKQSKVSILDNIEGVGDKTRKLLFKNFKNIDQIRDANFEEIDRVIHNKTVAKSIINSLSSPEE